MRSFALWLAGTLTAFGLLGGGYHLALSEDPHRVVVVLDSSYPMEPAWRRVPQALARLSQRRYTQFALLTEKSRVHGWQPRLRLGRVAPYAPRDFTKLADPDSFPEIAAAAEVYLVTNAPEAETAALGGWRVIRP